MTTLLKHAGDFIALWFRPGRVEPAYAVPPLHDLLRKVRLQALEDLAVKAETNRPFIAPHKNTGGDIALPAGSAEYVAAWIRSIREQEARQ